MNENQMNRFLDLMYDLFKMIKAENIRLKDEIVKLKKINETLNFKLSEVINEKQF